MISRREMLKTSGAVVAGLTTLPVALGRPASMDPDREQRSDEPVRSVDPFIGTGAHGHTYPGAQVPFGMVQLSPDNGVSGWDWCSGYHWSSERIVGFSHTHLSGTGIGDMYDVLVTPAFTAKPPVGDAGSRFTHQQETAQPGYYSVLLLDQGIRAELTATARVGVHRYEFPAPPPGLTPSIIVDLGHSLNWDRPTDTGLAVEGPTTISGRRLSTGWARDQHVYFAASFSRPFVSHWLESDWSTPGAHRSLAGERIKGCFQFAMRPGQRLIIKLAISPVSVESAKLNLRTEMPGWEFDAVRDSAVDRWNAVLGRISAPEADSESRALLYTALYHALLAPQLFCDVDGSYRGPDGAIHRGDFTNYSVFSLWDTFRAEHPLLTLVQPERVGGLIRSMLEFYREGGLLPVWSLAGNETNTMIGYHSVPVILDALEKGLADVDPVEALAAMKDSALQQDHGLRFYQMPRPESLAAIRDREVRNDLKRVAELGLTDLTDLGRLLNGYEHTISGEKLTYRSPYPDARSALLVRSEKGDRSIVWRTGPVSDAAAGRRISFVWLAGLDAGEGRRRFHLAVNGRHWLTFRGPRSSDRRFRESGPGGSRLTFRATHADQNGDLFGFMFLTLPSGLPSGERLNIEVSAEAAGTRDWYMTFERTIESRVSAENVFGFIERGGRRKQVAQVHIEHLDVPTEAHVTVADEEPVTARLAFGHNRVLAQAPLVERDTPVTVRVDTADGEHREVDLLLRPVRPFGYIPADLESQSVSKTLEYAYDDWCIARLADRLGESDDSALFTERAGFYRNLFDPSTGFMRGRLADGSWKFPFSPVAASHRQDEYTEGNAWQYSWFVPHDVRGLIELMGGREAFIAKLDRLFEQSSDIEGAPPDISGLIGQYAHGNEPGHHVAYLYVYAGAPWKTQERVRQITDALYDPTPEGLPGNEDCGQMSAWYIFSVLGFYPVNPAEGIYVIGTPHLDRVSLDLGGGRTFTVEAPGASSVNRYIQSATLEGKPLERAYIAHEEILAGGTLRFEMGDRPNESWAADPSAAPPSMTAG